MSLSVDSTLYGVLLLRLGQYKLLSFLSQHLAPLFLTRRPTYLFLSFLLFSSLPCVSASY